MFFQKAPSIGVTDARVTSPAHDAASGRSSGPFRRPLAFRRARWEERCPHLLCQPFQLEDCRGAAYVGTHEQHALFLALDQPTGQFRRGRGFTGTLQAGEQDDDRRLGTQVKARARPAHDLHQLLVKNADEGLAGCEALCDLGAECLGLDPVNESFDHRQRDVGLQEGDADFAQRLGDVFFRDAALAAQRFNATGQAGGEIVEHEGVRGRKAKDTL